MRALSLVVFVFSLLLLGTPASAEDLVVFSWNIKDLTADNISTKDRLAAICSAISESGADVSFLLETLRGADDIGKEVVDTLNKSYDQANKYEYRWSRVGQEGTRIEYGLAIIRTLSKGKIIHIMDYGFFDRSYSGAKDFVKVSVAHGTSHANSDSKSGNNSQTLQTKGPLFYGGRVPLYLTVAVEKDRKNVLETTIASWHAPGPSNNPAEIWQTVKAGLIKAEIPMVIGDFNFEGMRDVVRPHGTTKGLKHYDDAILLNDKYSIKEITSAPDRSTKATDHQWIRAVLRK